MTTDFPAASRCFVAHSSEIWPSIIPPIVVLLAIVTVILSRLFSAYAHAKEMRIQQLNNEIAKASGLEPIYE